MMSFPFICSNIPAAPAYGVYISLSIRYSTACGFYHDFLDRELLLRKKESTEPCVPSGYVEVESLTVATMTMTWPTVTEYLCHK
jgi:hypothetical protein